MKGWSREDSPRERIKDAGRISPNERHALDVAQPMGSDDVRVCFLRLESNAPVSVQLDVCTLFLVQTVTNTSKVKRKIWYTNRSRIAQISNNRATPRKAPKKEPINSRNNSRCVCLRCWKWKLDSFFSFYWCGFFLSFTPSGYRVKVFRWITKLFEDDLIRIRTSFLRNELV